MAKSSASGTHPALALLGRLPSLPAAAIRRARNRRKGRTSAHRDRPHRLIAVWSPRPPPCRSQCGQDQKWDAASICFKCSRSREHHPYRHVTRFMGRASRSESAASNGSSSEVRKRALVPKVLRSTPTASELPSGRCASDARAAPRPLHRRAAAENPAPPPPPDAWAARSRTQRVAGVGTTSEVTSSVQSAGVAESAWPTAAKRPSGDGVAPASPVQCVCRVAFHFKRAGDRTRVSTSVPDPGSASRSTAARHAQRWRRSCGVPTMSADADTAAASHARSARSSCAPATAASQ